MSILCKQQICINLVTIQNLGDLSYGKYRIEIKLFQQHPTYRKLSLPLSVLTQSNHEHPQNQPIITQKSYQSSIFKLVPNRESYLRQIVFFDHQFQVFSFNRQNWSSDLQFQAKLWSFGNQLPKFKGIFKGRIIGKNINEGLVLDFWQASTPCRIIGSIHTCIYNFHYSPSNIFNGNFEEFCKAFSRSQVEQLFKTLLKQIDKSNISHQNFLKLVGHDKEKQPRYPSRQSLQSLFEQKRSSYEKKKELQIRERIQKQRQSLQQNRRGFAGYRPQQQKINHRISSKESKYYSLKKFVQKQSHKIFTTPQKRRQQNFMTNITIFEFQKLLNDSCGVLYEKWSNNIIKVLKKSEVIDHSKDELPDNGMFQSIIRKFSSKSNKNQTMPMQKIVQMLVSQHNQKIDRLLIQCILNFDGDWKDDIYSKQQKYRQRLATEVRKHLTNFKIFDMSYGSQIFMYPLQFHPSSIPSEYNPVFFQQKVEKKVIEQIPKNIFNKVQSIISIQSQHKEKINKLHLIILVHGMGGSRFDMEMLKGEIKRYFYESRSEYRIVNSTSNESKTDEDIAGMGVRFAAEMRQNVSKIGIDNICKISFIGHSLGGIIIRLGISKLSELWHLFHSFVSFSSPHLGFSAPNSKIIDAGIWLMNNLNKTDSITQLTINDTEDKYQSFLYKLSTQPGLQHFKKITFFSSHQDSLIPFYSARIQKYEKTSKIRIKISKSKEKLKQKISSRRLSSPSHNESIDQGEISGVKVSECEFHNKMCDNIIARINDRSSRCECLRRVEVNFGIQNQNIDSIIGRAAHISYINNFQFHRLLLHKKSGYIF